MTAGFDRYFQIAPASVTRTAVQTVPRFYQLDLEMSFVTQEGVFQEVEAVMIEIFEEFSD